MTKYKYCSKCDKAWEVSELEAKTYHRCNICNSECSIEDVDQSELGYWSGVMMRGGFLLLLCGVILFFFLLI